MTITAVTVTITLEVPTNHSVRSPVPRVGGCLEYEGIKGLAGSAGGGGGEGCHLPRALWTRCALMSPFAPFLCPSAG